MSAPTWPLGVVPVSRMSPIPSEPASRSRTRIRALGRHVQRGNRALITLSKRRVRVSDALSVHSSDGVSSSTRRDAGPVQVRSMVANATDVEAAP